MSTISADIEFSGDLFSAARASTDVNRVVNLQLTRASLFMEGAAIQATPVGATNTLRSAWVSGVNQQTNTAVIFNPMEYALAVELGRKPAFIPIAPLALWVKRKLQVSDDKEARSIAFAISKYRSKHRKPKKQHGEPNEGRIRDTFLDNIPTINKHFLEPIGAQIVKALSQ